MGLFDVLTPLFSVIDDTLSLFASDWIILAFWGMVAAIVSTVVFKKCSNPEKITTLKSQLKDAQQALNDHDGEFDELKSLAATTMKLSIKRMALTFLPAMLASIPVIFLLTHLSNRYDLEVPSDGEPIEFIAVWEDPQIADHVFTMNWSNQKGQGVALLDSSNEHLIRLSADALSPVIHKKQWWNSLIGNPAGYLKDNSQYNVITIDYKSQEIIKFGPQWIRGWLPVLLFFTISFSVLFMVLFKVKF